MKMLEKELKKENEIKMFMSHNGTVNALLPSGYIIT